jgi:hypothetical protein
MLTGMYSEGAQKAFTEIDAFLNDLD